MTVSMGKTAYLLFGLAHTLRQKKKYSVGMLHTDGK